MPDWLVPFLIGSTGGGLAGYLLRSWIDKRFATRTESRHSRRTDLQALRDDLLKFLGEPNAHFTWLESVPDVIAAGGSPSPDAKAEWISTWVYKNNARYPKKLRGSMYLITNVAYQLASGDRHFLNTDVGPDAVANAWQELDDYADELTRELHGK